MSEKDRATQTDVTTPSKITVRTSDDPQPPFARDDFYRDLKKGEPDSQWEDFKDTLKKIAAVPKEEVDEMRASREREKKQVE